LLGLLIDQAGIKTSDSTFWLADDGLFYSDLIPSADSSRDLGSSSKYWANLYADTVYGTTLSGFSTISGNPNFSGSPTFSGSIQAVDFDATGKFTGDALVIGTTPPTATDDDIRAYADIACGGGLYVGSASANPTNGTATIYRSGLADVTIHGTGDGNSYALLSLQSDEATDKRWSLAHRVTDNEFWLYHYNGSTTVTDFRAGADGSLTIGPASAGAAKLYVYQDDNGGNIPALRLDQDDVDRDFISFVGTADSGLANSIVDQGDESGSSLDGWLKVYVQDDGNQIADGYYYLPIYTLSGLT
jgi:hypothetical protein